MPVSQAVREEYERIIISCRTPGMQTSLFHPGAEAQAWIEKREKVRKNKMRMNRYGD